jgi:hypothetical protein
VPQADPPYDDERGPQAGTPETYGSLALAPVQTARPYGEGRGALIMGPPGSLPDERRLRGLGQALAEILSGRRPPDTVQDRLTERAYAELCRAGKMIDTSRPPLVGLPHIQQPRAGSVEMCLLVHCGPRSRALAVRLERYGVQWLVTDFETA